MGNLEVKERDVVIPGEELATGIDYLPSKGTYRDGNKIVAAQLGLIMIEGKVVKIIPLSGRYAPKRGDIVIGKVVDVTMSAWRLEINCAYSAMMSLAEATSSYIQRGADLTRFYDIGDFVVAIITNVTSQKLVDLSMKGPGLRKLEGGLFIEVKSNKVPRIIGKQGSMVTMIKEATNCRITVGQNGIVWISGEPKMETIAIGAIKKIEKESHVSGLTENIKTYLDKELKGVKK